METAAEFYNKHNGSIGDPDISRAVKELEAKYEIHKMDWVLSTANPDFVYKVIQTGRRLKVHAYGSNGAFSGVFMFYRAYARKVVQQTRYCRVCGAEVMHYFTRPAGGDVLFKIELPNLDTPIRNEYRCKDHNGLLAKDDFKDLTPSQTNKLKVITRQYGERVLGAYVTKGKYLAIDVMKKGDTKYRYKRIFFGRRAGWIGKAIATDYDFKHKDLDGDIVAFDENDKIITN